MRLLIITQKMDSSDPILGFFHRWVEEFAKNCESVIVVCLFEGEHTLPANVRVLSLGKEEGVSRIKYLKRFFSYIWKERGNYSAVFVHMNQIYVILGGLLWRMLGKKVSWWYAHGAVSLSMRMAEKFAQIIFTSTPQGFRLKSSKVHIVGQGIDTALFSPVTKKESQFFRIVSVGRIGPVKHLELLIKALPLIHTERPGAQLELFGAPQTEDERRYKTKLEHLVASSNLSGFVHFRGSVNYIDLPSVLADADVFAQASQTGSLDKAVLEALAMNVPAVSTNEVFENFPGVLFTGQTPEELSRAILAAPTDLSSHDYIVANHSLPKLIITMVGFLHPSS